MIKTSFPTNDQRCCPAALQEWLDDHLAYFIRRGGPLDMSEVTARLRAGTTWRAAVSSTDAQGVALRLLLGVLTPHRPASPRGHRLRVSANNTFRSDG